MQTDPRTKSDFLNRMMSFDFDGDIRHLGAESARLSRIRANAVRLVFPTSGKEFELVVRIPRGPKAHTPKAKTPVVEAAPAAGTKPARKRRAKTPAATVQ